MPTTRATGIRSMPTAIRTWNATSTAFLRKSDGLIAAWASRPSARARRPSHVRKLTLNVRVLDHHRRALFRLDLNVLQAHVLRVDDFEAVVGVDRDVLHENILDGHLRQPGDFAGVFRA